MPSAPTPPSRRATRGDAGRASGRRMPRGSVVALVTMAGALGVVGCASDDPPGPPTLPTIDFTATAVVVLDDGALRAEDGPGPDEPSSLDPLTVPGGSVLEVVNDGEEPGRLRAGTAFDTGTLLPGERTVVVLANDGDADRRLPLDDGATPAPPDGDDGPLGTLVVTPRPTR